MWKKFSLLYWPSTVNPLCADAAYDSCGTSSCVPTLTNTRLLNPPIERNVGYPVGRVTKMVVFLPAEPTIGGGCLLSFRLSLSYSVHSRCK